MSRRRQLECDCGRPARYKKSGHMVCEICNRLEREGFTGGPVSILAKAGDRPGCKPVLSREDLGDTYRKIDQYQAA